MADLSNLLGRRHAPDPRDRAFPIRALLAAPEAPPAHRRRYWNASRWWGDQSQTPEVVIDGEPDHPYCVGFSWAHWAAAGPLVQAPPDPLKVYAMAQDRDEWQGPPPVYGGTSVRAGAKAILELGMAQSYRWAETIGDVERTLADVGPMVFGTNFYAGMFDPDPRTGLIHVTGALAGGHAYLVDGINLDRGVARIKNSWGRAWGHNGFAWIELEELERLLHEDGEACIAVETRAA